MNPHRTNLAEMTDEQLAAAARGESVAAFDAIARRYQVPLLRYLLRRLPSRSDAEDVLQETFVRAWQHLDQYRDGAAFKSWLFAIARNTAVSFHRKPRIATAVDVETLPAGAVGHDEADTKQRLWDVARALLSDDQYDVLWLHYVEDLPTTEVARVMRRSWVSVKTLLVRARRRLAPHMAKLYDLEPRAITQGAP